MTRVAYHLTDDPEFQIDPARVVLGRPDPERGTQQMTGVLYVTETPQAWIACSWTGGRRFIAEIEWDATGDEHETTYTRCPVPKHEVLIDASRARVLAVRPA